MGVDPSAAPQLRACFRNLLIAPSGVLFDDATITIGVQSQAVGPVARLMLHFKNKSHVRIFELVVVLLVCARASAFLSRLSIVFPLLSLHVLARPCMALYVMVLRWC